MAEYHEVRATRNLASESAVRLFQYYQVAIMAALVVVLADTSVNPFALAGLTHQAQSVLLDGVALVLTVLAADILHWHLDVMTLEDYQERALRPQLSREVGRLAIRAEEHIAAIRGHGDMRDLTPRNLAQGRWVDPFVLKEVGHILVLGLPAIMVAFDAFRLAEFNVGLVVLSLAAGAYGAAVWASYWSSAFAYLTWRTKILPRFWRRERARQKVQRRPVTGSSLVHELAAAIRGRKDRAR